MWVVVVAVLLRAVSASHMAGEPGWRVGWGFESHGGFPANPWHSWAMNKSTAVYVSPCRGPRCPFLNYVFTIYSIFQSIFIVRLSLQYFLVIELSCSKTKDHGLVESWLVLIDSAPLLGLCSSP